MVTLRVAVQTSRGVLLQNDCLEVLRGLKAETVHTVFADPPFNLGKAYGNGTKDRRTTEEYLDWCKTWLSECTRVLRSGGSLLLYNLPEWNMHLGSFLAKTGTLSFRHWIAVSMKNGHTPPGRLQPAHYSLLYLTKGEPATFDPDSVRYPMPLCRHCGRPIPDWGGYTDKLNPKGINLSDIWTDLSPVRHRSIKKRPRGVNELPVKLVERVILLTTKPGDIVLDPFGGGGTTFEIAEKNDRFWLGSEIGDCDPIRERLANTSGVQFFPCRQPGRLHSAFKKTVLLEELRPPPIPS